jgi:O-antigen chain-terminating methyltransferase
MTALRDRERAERLWAVSADRAPLRRPGLRGALTAPAKALVRPLVRWYVAPLADSQRDFNDVTLKLVDDLHGQVEEGLDRRRVDELEERVLRLERATRGARRERLGTVPSGDSPRLDSPRLDSPRLDSPPELDYFAFEARMRGSTEDVRGRQEVYVDDFRDTAPVLDVGCGRGEFLGLLREAGIAARGVDSDADMVEFCRAEGLEVEHADALVYLAGLEDASLGGIFAAQVVEHLRPPSLLRLLELAAAKLRPGGVLVAETMNPLALGALKNYFADLTHAQPLVPETLVVLARQAGFASTGLRFLNEPAPEERLRPVELPDDPAFDAARIALAANVARLNDVIFGPQDYALVASR